MISQLRYMYDVVCVSAWQMYEALWTANMYKKVTTKSNKRCSSTASSATLS